MKSAVPGIRRDRVEDGPPAVERERRRVPAGPSDRCSKGDGVERPAIDRPPREEGWREGRCFPDDALPRLEAPVAVVPAAHEQGFDGLEVALSGGLAQGVGFDVVPVPEPRRCPDGEVLLRLAGQRPVGVAAPDLGERFARSALQSAGVAVDPRQHVPPSSVVHPLPVLQAHRRPEPAARHPVEDRRRERLAGLRARPPPERPEHGVGLDLHPRVPQPGPRVGHDLGDEVVSRHRRSGRPTWRGGPAGGRRGSPTPTTTRLAAWPGRGRCARGTRTRAGSAR